MNPLHKAYSILGLEPGSSLVEVRARYKRLIEVWHPERFSTFESKRDAEAELNKISYAIELIIDHFESGDHKDNACECLLDTKVTAGEAVDAVRAASAVHPDDAVHSDDAGAGVDTVDEEEGGKEHYRTAMRTTGSKKRKQKKVGLNELRDRRFERMLQGDGDTGTDEDEEKPREGRINEKVLNWILIAVAGILFLGWLVTSGPASGPDQVKQSAPPQALQSAPGQTQQPNPLQQLLRSGDEQTQQPSQEQSQEGAQE
jgi:hypothetical protein